MVVKVPFERVLLANGFPAAKRADHSAALALHHSHEPMGETVACQSCQ